MCFSGALKKNYFGRSKFTHLLTPHRHQAKKGIFFRENSCSEAYAFSKIENPESIIIDFLQILFIWCRRNLLYENLSIFQAEVCQISSGRFGAARRLQLQL